MDSMQNEDSEQKDTIVNLQLRVAQLENELVQTNSKLSSTELALTTVESRCAATEALCAELRQHVSGLYALLETFRGKNAALSSGDADGNANTVAENQPADATSTSPIGIVDATSSELPVAECSSELSVGDGVLSYDSNKSVETAHTEWTNGQVDSSSGMQIESIADCVRAAAESAVVESNFVYDSRTGLYYDYITGYYYDAEKSLYYEPQSGLYFYYDEASREYKYHSRVDAVRQKQLTHIILGNSANPTDKKDKTGRRSKRLQKSAETTDVQRFKHKSAKMVTTIREQNDVDMVHMNRKERRKYHLQDGLPSRTVLTPARSDFFAESVSAEVSSAVDKRSKVSGGNVGSVDGSSSESMDELEDGELATSNSECSDDAASIEETAVTAEEMQHCTPCIRAMVIQSNSLPVSSLFIITCTGGTIGRDADLGHSIVIPDPLVSKMHCSVSYDDDRQRYVVRDHASQAGTFINNKRLAKAKTMSEPHVVYHGDTLRLAGTTFDLHIHQRAETCSGCEPGCAQQAPKEDVHEENVRLNEDKERERRRQLKKLKSKFGLARMNYEEHPSVLASGGDKKSYVDRAAERRQTVGSEAPIDSRCVETASVHRPISDTNIGRKMLSKMGWKEGESLGKNREDAITEPINVEVRLKQTAGLGAYVGAQRSLDDVNATDSSARWIKAQDRYAKLSTNQRADTDSSDPVEHCSRMTVTRTSKDSIKWVKKGADAT